MSRRTLISTCVRVNISTCTRQHANQHAARPRMSSGGLGTDACSPARMGIDAFLRRHADRATTAHRPTHPHVSRALVHFVTLSHTLPLTCDATCQATDVK